MMDDMEYATEKLREFLGEQKTKSKKKAKFEPIETRAAEKVYCICSGCGKQVTAYYVATGKKFAFYEGRCKNCDSDNVAYTRIVI